MPPIRVRWLDTYKGNGVYRSRLVAMEFKTDNQSEFFSPTVRSMEHDDFHGRVCSVESQDLVRQDKQKCQVRRMHTDVSPCI